MRKIILNIAVSLDGYIEGKKMRNGLVFNRQRLLNEKFYIINGYYVNVKKKLTNVKNKDNININNIIFLKQK